MVHFVTWADYSGFSFILGFQRAQGSGVLDLEHSDLHELNVNFEGICEPVDNHAEIGQVGNVYTMGVGQCYKSRLRSPLPPALLYSWNLLAH